MEKLEELNYHVDFGPYYVHLTRKQKKYLAVRSVIDRILAALALILLSPLFLVVSIAQKLSAPDEPIFFLQKRVGKGAHCFNIIKFRTMKSSAPKNVATGDLESPETYISRLGRFLRDTSIDELPQLIDILKGDLSVVGPRPERPQIAAEYEETMPEFRLRLQAKAGLTGYAQVYGKYNTRPYDKLRMDLMYIAHPSIIEDLRICLATVKILFLPESTEGIAEGQSTAMEEPREEAADNEVKV